MNKIKILSIICATVVLSIVITANAAEVNSSSSKKILPAVRKNFEQKDIRNNNLEQKDRKMGIFASSTERERKMGIFASSTEREREGEREIERAGEVRKGMRASTTMMFKEIKDQKKEMLKKMKTNEFQIRKNALLKELEISISNLMKSREQVSKRVSMMASSTNEKQVQRANQAKTALTIADEKIIKAKAAIDLFSKTVFVPVTNTNSTSTDISLDKPRKIGDEAIKAVKEARDSLKKVLEVFSDSPIIKNSTASSTRDN